VACLAKNGGFPPKQLTNFSMIKSLFLEVQLSFKYDKLLTVVDFAKQENRATWQYLSYRIPISFCKKK